MKRIINKLLRKIFWLLLPLIKENYMSKSIDDLIEKRVLYGISPNYRPILKTKVNGTNFSTKYELEFPDGKTFIFEIVFDPHGLEYHFVSSDIYHLGVLQSLITNLMSRLLAYEDKIMEYFLVDFENSKNRR